MRGRGPRRHRRGAVPLSGALALGLSGSGCANVQAPPGALPDNVPPRVTEIVPGRDTVVPGFDGSVRIRFDEPVNFPNDLARRLVASPLEPYVVQTGFSDVRLRPRDGWKEGVIYCVRLPGGLSDVLRNRAESAIDFCFSTGPPLADTRVSGTVRDAVTGQPQSDARVMFLALPADSTPYGWITDAEGRFELRALPPRSYRAFAFIDRNRNLALDRALEPYDSASVELAATGARDLAFELVEPDSTPPRLLRAEALDSLTVRLEFDDPLKRPQPDAAAVTVRDSATGEELPVLAVLVGDPAEVELPSPAAPPDTLAGIGAEAAPDSTIAPADTTAGAEAGAAADTAKRADPRAGADTARALLVPDTLPPRPSPTVSVRLGVALRPGAYSLAARGFVNLRDLVGGGDTTFVYPPGDLPAADTAGEQPPAGEEEPPEGGEEEEPPEEEDEEPPPSTRRVGRADDGRAARRRRA